MEKKAVTEESDTVLSNATKESIKILLKTDIAAKTMSLLLAVPETLEAEQEFLEWLKTHDERDIDTLFKAAVAASHKYPPED